VREPWPRAERPKAVDAGPDVLVVLDSLVEPEGRGGPTSPLRRTVKSARQAAEELTRLGLRMVARPISRTLHYMGYRLQANAMLAEGAEYPDRDSQCRYINDPAVEHLAAGQPVISTDCKKKELVGYYAYGGVEWESDGEPTRVRVHDFPASEVRKAIPYDIYHVGANEGWGNVGDDHHHPLTRWRRLPHGGSGWPPPD
jgi:hypothetical protein